MSWLRSLNFNLYRDETSSGFIPSLSYSNQDKTVWQHVKQSNYKMVNNLYIFDGYTRVVSEPETNTVHRRSSSGLKHPIQLEGRSTRRDVSRQFSAISEVRQDTWLAAMCDKEGHLYPGDVIFYRLGIGSLWMDEWSVRMMRTSGWDIYVEVIFLSRAGSDGAKHLAKLSEGVECPLSNVTLKCKRKPLAIKPFEVFIFRNITGMRGVLLRAMAGTSRKYATGKGC